MPKLSHENQHAAGTETRIKLILIRLVHVRIFASPAACSCNCVLNAVAAD